LSEEDLQQGRFGKEKKVVLKNVGKRSPKGSNREGKVRTKCQFRGEGKL